MLEKNLIISAERKLLTRSLRETDLSLPYKQARKASFKVSRELPVTRTPKEVKSILLVHSFRYKPVVNISSVSTFDV